LIGGTAAGTALILFFLPALYSIWYRVVPAATTAAHAPDGPSAHAAVIEFHQRRVAGEHA
jgi:hypothetical protein